MRKYQSKIKYWVSEPDSGQSYAINEGIKLSSGDVIGWLCSDDLYTSDAHKKLLHFFGMILMLQ